MRRPKTATSLSRKHLLALPEILELRLIHTKIKVRGFRDEDLWLLTTLTDAEPYPAAEILRAYRMRWEIELGFRDVKTSMGAEFLRYRTPEMVVKGRASSSWRTTSCNCWRGKCWAARWSRSGPRAARTGSSSAP